MSNSLLVTFQKGNDNFTFLCQLSNISTRVSTLMIHFFFTLGMPLQAAVDPALAAIHGLAIPQGPPPGMAPFGLPPGHIPPGMPGAAPGLLPGRHFT